MKRKTAIKSTSLPTRSPIGSGVLLWLFLEHVQAPGWAYGALWTVIGIAAINWLYCIATTTEKDVTGFGEK